MRKQAWRYENSDMVGWCLFGIGLGGSGARRYGLGRGVGNRITLEARAGSEKPIGAAGLLHRMREFVSEQTLAFARVRVVAVGAEEDILAHGKGASANGAGGLGGAAAGVDANAGEANTQARFHNCSRGRLKGATG